MKKDILDNKELNRIRRKYQAVIKIENIGEKKNLKKKKQSKLYEKWLKDSKD